MIFNKNNPLHYLIFLNICLSIFIGMFFYLFNNKKRNNIVLFGHKLIGNLETLKSIHKVNESEIIYYFTLNLKDYRSLTKKNSNILNGYNPFHWIIFLKSKLIISSHSILFHKFFKNYFNLTTIYTGHSIKSNNNSILLNEQMLFDEVWLYSDLEKYIYEKTCKYKGNNLVVTGYPRIESLLQINKMKNKIKNELNINSNIILYAPTDALKNKDYINNKFSPHSSEIYEFLENFGELTNSKILIKLHIKTKLNKDLLKIIYDSENLMFSSILNKYPDITPLSISDILITDWSSVFTDFLILNKPVLFLDIPKSYTASGISKVFDNNFVYRISSYEDLQKILENAINENFLPSKDLFLLKNLIFSNQDYSNNLSNCIDRIKKYI